ncbi:MAG: OmpA family protein [Cyclobacteriaceae bacterium]|nr:OmpA family protein [Cyclobacteriaceae bacterium]
MKTRFSVLWGYLKSLSSLRHACRQAGAIAKKSPTQHLKLGLPRSFLPRNDVIYRFLVMPLILLCLSLSLSGQNLVPNPSFEELIRCPHSFSADRSDFIVPGWFSATKGTPDQFHTCSWTEADVPYNWAGSSNAKTGKGYVGIYAWMKRDDENHYREYIECELAEPLRAGKRYRLEFYFKLASYSVYSANRIGMLLSTDRIILDHDQVISIAPTLSIENDSSITESTGGWEHAVMEYSAQGGELFVTIGNFFGNNQTQYTKLPHRTGKSSMLSTSAYYYIDDVSVTPLDVEPVSTETVRQLFDLEKVELNKDYILKNIQFEFDSYTLLSSSFKELNQVAEYLLANPNLNVRLSGHTDFLGTDEYNIVLSQNRARSVADYLISKGVKHGRINSFGFGKSRPIAPEKTDEARSINRRVEIRFIEGLPGDKF